MLHLAIDKLAGKLAIRQRYDNFIGGKWAAPVRGQYFTNTSPVTGHPVCEITRSTAEDIELRSTPPMLPARSGATPLLPSAPAS